MNRSPKNILKAAICALLLISILPISIVSAADTSFRNWIDAFYPRAAEQGISRTVYDQAFSGVTEPDSEVLRKAAYQPEFTVEIWDYIDTVVNKHTIERARAAAVPYAGWLKKIEQRLKVDVPVLLAIWSIESGCGTVLERPGRMHYVPRALATLAYADKSRRKFGEQQLIAALQIVQQGNVSLQQFYGSWAGAMGHTQFIPTSYQAYSVDMDGDGRRDIWNSVPDALATAANLLHKNGWRTGKAWGYEVRVPARGAQYTGKTKTLAQWRELGFTRPDGIWFPEPAARAELLLPAGAAGPGFLVLRNFFMLKRYNNSDFYALAVGLLADRLAGKKGMRQNWPRPPDSLVVAEKFELQQLLQKKGFYDGVIDGDLGSKTRQGIREFQQKLGLPSDGKPTRKVLQALRN
ncbi:MAG: lytic murein transglycosylase [Candidatus Electrothrix sp. YB6]